MQHASENANKETEEKRRRGEEEERRAGEKGTPGPRGGRLGSSRGSQ